MKTHKVRPTLVATKNRVHDIYMIDTLEYHIDGKLSINGIEQQLILVSLEDEKIEVGDLVCDGKYIEKAITDNYIVSKKVIATQDQLSPEYIQQFIEEYRNGKVKDVEIEIIDIPNSSWGFSEDEPMYLGYKPKLTNGFITIVSKPKLYTEEEVKEFCYKAMKYKGYTEYNECMDWFEQNKKK